MRCSTICIHYIRTLLCLGSHECPHIRSHVKHKCVHLQFGEWLMTLNIPKYLHIFLSLRTWHPILGNWTAGVRSSPNTAKKKLALAQFFTELISCGIIFKETSGWAHFVDFYQRQEIQKIFLHFSILIIKAIPCLSNICSTEMPIIKAKSLLKGFKLENWIVESSLLLNDHRKYVMMKICMCH